MWLMIAWFSANAFVGTITPVKNGGIPHLAELKLVFKEGEAFEFYNTYTALLDRLHAQEGQGEAVDHLEDLPMYSNANVQQEPDDAATPTTASNGTSHDAPVEVVVERDLPPAYDDVASDDGERGRRRTRH